VENKIQELELRISLLLHKIVTWFQRLHLCFESSKSTRPVIIIYDQAVVQDGRLQTGNANISVSRLDSNAIPMAISILSASNETNDTDVRPIRNKTEVDFEEGGL